MQNRLILCLSLLTSTLLADVAPFQAQHELKQPQINFHNRPLIKVNGRTISLIDVIKKMDLFLLSHYPQALDDPASMHQYYTTHWKQTFTEMVESELIVLDSEALKITISEADIREELETTIGGHLIAKLDKINLSLEEVKTITEKDLIVKQMTWFKAYSKAMQSVTPEMIKIAYQETVKKEQTNQKEEWCYQVLTVKSPDIKKSESAAKSVYTILTTREASMQNAPQILKVSHQEAAQDVEVLTSKEMIVDSLSISKQHQDILSKLSVDQYSEPVLQQVRNSNESVYRIFHLKRHSKVEPRTFDQLATGLKDKLTQIAAEKEKKVYVEGLKKRYHITEQDLYAETPKDYEPFALL
jgi:hypothetical protein